MRELVDVHRVHAFMRAIGLAAGDEGICYFTGGVTAILLGWRETTIDLDIRLEQRDEVVRRRELDVHAEGDGRNAPS